MALQANETKTKATKEWFCDLKREEEYSPNIAIVPVA